MCGSRETSDSVVSRRVVREFTVSEVLYKGGTALARHAHAKANLTIIVAGEYVENVRGKSELCRAGAIRLLPAGEHHESRFAHDSRCLVVDVDPDLLHCIRRGSAIYTRAGQVRSPRVEQLGIRLYNEFRAFDDLSPLVMEGMLFEILAETERHWRTSRHEPNWLKTVYQLLRDRFADDLSLAEIAAAAGVHPVYLCREFKKRQRMTIGGFMRHLRIKRACDLLRNSRLPLAEIALQCGFADQSHFSAVFKRITGKTPSVFRTT